MAKTAIAEKESTEMGTKIASEAITNIRTVASLSKFLFNLIIFCGSSNMFRSTYSEFQDKKNI